MDTTKAQQIALDDALVAPANHLKIGKCNHRLSSTLKSNEPTIQVVLDALKLTPFYKAFQITANVPEIYMQEFWATVSIHHKSLHFKMNEKSHTLNLENFRDMLQIFPRLPYQKFEDAPLEEEILYFIRDLGLDSLRLSRAQIIWGMYHKKNVDYVYLLWEDLVYQVENKKSKKNNDMYDPMFNTIRVISRHQDTKVYDVILPDELTNQDMKDSEAYKQYYTSASGEEPPKEKTKYKKKVDESNTSPKKNTAPATKGSRLKTSAKAAKSVKKKQRDKKPITKGLTILSEVALSEAEQLKMATKRSKIQFHSSHASGSGDGVDTQSKVPDEQQQNVSGTNEGAGDGPEVPNVPEYKSESEEESWTFSQGDDNDEHDLKDEKDDENDDDKNDSKETKSDDDGDDFVHPNLSTYKADDQEEEEEKDNDDDEVSSDQKVSTLLDREFTEEEENQEGDDYVKEGEQEDEEEELYGDLNINLERGAAEMTVAQANKETDDAHVTLTAEPPVVQRQSSFVSSDLVSNYINPSLDTGIDSILNQNVQSHNLVNVPVSVAAVTPSSASTIPQPLVPIIQTLQKTLDSTTTTTIPITKFPDIPNFAFVFRFDQRVSALETEMSEFKQTNQFSEDVSLILAIVDNYLASKLKDAVDIDSNMKAIIKEQVKAQVFKIMQKTSYAVVASLSEFKLKKNLIDKIDENKSINISDITLKRGRDDQDKDKDPSAGSNRGSKKRRSGKEAKSLICIGYSLKDKNEVKTTKQSMGMKFDRISFRETPKVLLLAWKKFFEIKHACKEKQHQQEDLQELFHKLLKDLQIISEELADYINIPNWNCPAFYEDDDEEYTIAITPVLPTEEPDNSLSMGEEHLSTNLETGSNQLIKSSVENLVPIPSESEDFSDIENPHHFNAESNLIESLLNQDTSIISSPKIDSLLEEFSGELAHIDLIPPGINETDFDSEEEIRLVEKLLYETSSPRPPEEFNSENSNAIIESFSPSPILVKDSDSLMEEIDLFLTPDDSMPPGIENDDYDYEGDILFLEELPINDSPLLPENESFHFDVPSSPRPPAKPSDDGINFEPDTGVFTKVVDDISDNSTRELYVHVPNVLTTLPTLCPVIDTLLPFSSENEDKVHLLSHRGFKTFPLSSENPMMTHEEDIPILDVPFLHFYPP
ncbi:hypothetical protein Tco_1319547 [Tanacetum coccineum]